MELINVELRVRILHFKTENEVLEIKCPNIGVRVIQEYFYFPTRVHQVFIEENWVSICICENGLKGVGLEISKRSPSCHQGIHKFYYKSVNLKTMRNNKIVSLFRKLFENLELCGDAIDKNFGFGIVIIVLNFIS